MTLSDDTMSLLASPFGHQHFRGCQQQVIEHVMLGRHALVIMPTGMGKSLCYQIPAVSPRPDESGVADRSELTLVLSPLIALMKDQVDSLQRKGVRAAYINSSLSRDQRHERYQEVARGEYDLLYVTPERFRKPDFLEVLASRRIKLLAVDEAHCISEWGHDFRPDYTRLREIRQILENPTTIALTATATPAVQTDIVRQLGLNADDVRMFHEGIDRPNLSLNVKHVNSADEKLETIQQHLPSEGSSIVYFTLIKSLEAFSDQLIETRVPHVVYHGKLDRSRRRRLQDAFMSGDEPLVLATNAFGMGVDKEDIRLVMHADLPGSMEAYYQEIGRAGRDGQPSECLLLYNQVDLAMQMEFIQGSNPGAEFYQRVWDLLTIDTEKVRAFGWEWMAERIFAKGQRDNRLDTALAMLERHEVIEPGVTADRVQVLRELPEPLRDDQQLADKLRRDQEKLLALVNYVHHQGDRKAYIHDYFGLPYHAPQPDTTA